MSSTNIQIAIKVRPFVEREKRNKQEPLWLIKENSIVQIDSTHNFIGEPYSFDHIFDDTKSNRDVYDSVVKPLVMTCLEGVNSTIFAYGQTSSGKTHTMLGDNNVPGIIKFAVDDIFKYIEENTTKNFLLRCSYLEIYNESINDLLDTNAKNIKIREDYNQGVYVEVREEVVRKHEELFNLIKKGMKTRKIGCTNMNERSSRSHTIFKLVIQSQNKDSEGSYTESTLSLVDLAGSERVGQMNMGRVRQVEGVSINKSLTTLGLVIRKLSENETYINYRDSKLTRLLQYSLGGNSRTLIIATITIAAVEETKSTLEFAQRAKYVKNRPIINERVTTGDQIKQYEHLCEDYKVQIEKLRLQNIESVRTINELEDKICNIKLFAAGNLEKSAKSNQVPHRRHTLAHYKLHKKGLSIKDTGEEEEKSIFDYSISSSTYSLIPNNSPSMPETPNLMLEKELLEEPFIDLKSFADIENQLQRKNKEVEELQQLNQILQNEVSELRKEKSRISDNCITITEDNKSICEKLILLKNILEVKPLEQMRRQSLHSILEEDIELFQDDSVSPISNSEIVDVSALSDFSEVMSEVNRTYTNVYEENEHLKLQLKEKDIIIDKLKNDISKGSSSKLDEEVTNLKTQIDDLQKQLLKKQDQIKIFEENVDGYLKEIQVLRTTCDDQKNESKELQNQLHSKLIELDEKSKCYNEMVTKYNIKVVEHEYLTNEKIHLKKDLDKLSELLQQEISAAKDENNCLKEENVRLKSELEDAVFQLSGEQKELENCFQQLEDKTKDIDTLKQIISDLKHTQKNTEDPSKIRDDKIQQLEESVHKYLKEIQVLQIACDHQKNEADELRNQLHCKILELDEKHNCFNELNIKYNAKLTEYESLLNENIHLKKDLDKLSELLQQEISAAKDENNCLKEENVRLKSELEDALFQLSGEQKELENCFQQLEDKTKDIDTLKQIISDLKHTKKNTEGPTKIRDDKTQQLEESVHKYLKEIQVLQIACDYQKNEADELRNQLHCKILELDEKNNSFNELHIKYNAKLTEYESLLNENVCLKKDLEKLSELPQQEISATKDENNCLKEENVRLKSELEDVLFQLNKEQKELENCFQQLEDKTKDIDTLKQIISDLKYTQKNTEDRTNVRDDKTQQLEESVHKYLKEIQVLQIACDCQKNEADELRNQLHCKILELDEKNNCFNELHIKYNAKLTEYESLLNENIHLKKDLEKLSELPQQEISAAKDENDCLKEENVRLKSELEDALFQLNKEQKELENCFQQLEDKTKDIDTLKQIISDLKYTQKNTEDRTNVRDDKTQQLEESVHKYLKEIQVLQIACDRQKNEADELRNQLHCKILELDEKNNCFNKLHIKYNAKLTEYECLLNENRQLKKDLDELSEMRQSKVIEYDKLTLEITELKRQLIHSSGLHAKIFKSKNEVIELTSKLDRVTNQLKISQDEVIKLKTNSRLKSEELENLKKDVNSKCTHKELEEARQELRLRISQLTLANKEIETMKRLAEKDPKLSLSDEGRPSSPNDLRRNKRYSLHDQRRGLTNDSSEIGDDQLDCPKCLSSKTYFSKTKEEIEQLTKDNKFLNEENDDMLKIIKNLKKNVGELYNELNKYKALEAENKKGQKSKETQTFDHRADKETQATCDMHLKYKSARQIAIWRREEGNFLRSKLRLPRDCPVLPQDMQQFRE